MRRAPIVPLLLGLAATVAHGQQTARIVHYHANDIVSIRAKMRYTTLIQFPPRRRSWRSPPETRTSGSSIRSAITASCIPPRKASTAIST